MSEPLSPSPAVRIDHTLLSPTADSAAVAQLCEDAVEWGFAAVCLAPTWVPLAADRLYGSEVAVATVIGFPLGASTTPSKVFETEQAVAQGASEIDMVISLGAALEGRLDAVEEEIRQVVTAAGPASVKVILECCYLDTPLKQTLTERVVTAGAAFVKTSTGFGPGGASLEDVRLLAETAGGRIGVKASGGIRDWPTCQAMLAAGATRIGTSAGVAILRQWQQSQSA